MFQRCAAASPDVAAEAGAVRPETTAPDEGDVAASAVAAEVGRWT